MKKFRDAGKGKLPSGLAVEKTNKSAAEITAGIGIGLTVGGGAVYGASYLLAEDDTEDEDFNSTVDRYMAEDEAVEELTREIKAERRTLARKQRAIDKAQAKLMGDDDDDE